MSKPSPDEEPEPQAPPTHVALTIAEWDRVRQYLGTCPRDDVEPLLRALSNLPAITIPPEALASRRGG